MTYYPKIDMWKWGKTCLWVVILYSISLFSPFTVQVSAETYSKAECVIEVNSRQILHEKDANVALPMASTTKILTCITVLEVCKNLNECIKIPSEAVGIEGSSVYLREGETYTALELLYGLMLRSGNDCAVTLALHFGGTVARFATFMNIVAEKSGAINSQFVNPHGLPQAGHYTTARDLALIACYALENPTFCEIVSAKSYAAKQWKNKNKMLTRYEGAIGVKTGYTKQAGRCLVSAATRETRTLVCVVLGCPTMYERSMQLLDEGFSNFCG